jgi:ribosomal-protein-serine acetyltransferase
MTIPVNDQIRLELIHSNHAHQIFDLVDRNRIYLRPWLSFVDHMTSVDFAANFVKGTIHRNQEGLEYAFVIFEGEQMIGRIGVFKIDHQNKIGEMGYWLAENVQGKGFMSMACKSIIHFCFETLFLNRIEIKCGTENHKSLAIPKKLGFMKEGILRQAELLHGTYIDLYVFSLLRSEYEPLT